MKRDLPTDKAQRARVLRSGMELARSYRNPLTVEWAMTYWYMQGVRNFRVTSYREGTFRWSYDTPEGDRHIRIEDTVKQFQRQLGVYQKIDVHPAVEPKGLGLQSMQKAATGQVICDHIAYSVNLPNVQMEVNQLDLMYGNGAMVASVNPDVSLVGNMRPRLITAPPWQILPDPGRPVRREEVNGIFYHRWAPYRWIAELFKDRLNIPSESEEKLRMRRVAMGDKIDVEYNDGTANRMLVQNRPNAWSDAGGDSSEDDEPWVEVIEWWNYDDMDRVCGYEVMLGDWIATKDTFKSYSNIKMPCLPVGWFGCQLSGGFWNRGWAPLLIPNNVEMEKMYSSLYKNVSEMDDMRWFSIPNTSGITDEALTPAKGRPKVLRYEPDYSAEKLKPEMLQFETSGDFPGRVAGSAVQIADRLGGASDIFSGKAPGRVDSASGLGLLYEAVGIQNIPAAESQNRAYTTIYRAFLQMAKKMFEGRKTLPLLSLDDDLVGLIIDSETGEMVLDESSIPDPDDVIISIRDKQPKMMEQMRNDAVAMRDKQQLTPVEFAWHCYKNKLGLPVGYEVEIEEIRKCKFRNILQWNDGKTPGGVQPSSFDMHQLQMKYIQRFMARPIFMYASQPVRDAIEQRFKFHKAALGGFPDGIPYPEDMEEQAAAIANPEEWGGAGGMDPNALPPQLARMMQQAPPEGGPEGQQ